MAENGDRREEQNRNNEKHKARKTRREREEARRARIRQLNDWFRRTGRGGIVNVTAGIATLDGKLVNRIMLAVSAFEAFNDDNDPYREHDCAVLTVEGVRIIWKIDYYDRTMKYGSDDPADPTKTRRVLTIMLAEEW